MNRKNDGPYIFYHKANIESVSVDSNANLLHEIHEYTDPSQLEFVCKSATTKHQFSYRLKVNEASNKFEFQDVESVFVLSDIEGNFKSFTKLLIQHHIVDEDLNWIFQKGHLVIVGDVFDRENDVLACLWLIYKLESEADTFQGKVHFLLGNHDVMNLSGDVRYVKKKYLKLAKKLHLDYKQLFSESTELGKWLRTKAAIIKINNSLYVHAGISSKMCNIKPTLVEINQLIRIYLGCKTSKIPIDQEPARLLFSNQGPFWYRGYFLDYKDYYKQIKESNLDQILNYFKVNHIIVGHTTFKKVTVLYNKKIIAVDIYKPSKPQKKEALFIFNNQYFRAKENGVKRHLFSD